MAYSALKDVLTKRGETGLEVESAFILKFGCIRLLQFEEPKFSSGFPVTELEKLLPKDRKEDDQLSNLHTKILEALEKHPNVFNITPLEKKEHETLWPTAVGMLSAGSLFFLRVHLPERLQKHREWSLEEEKGQPEEFYVVSSGSLFAAYVEIQDYSVRTNIGHEYRDILKSQVETVTNLKCPPIGPSPIHADFYVVFRKTYPERTRAPLKIYVLKRDVFIVIDPGSYAFRDVVAADVVAAVFKKCEHPLLRFYELQMQRHFLIDYNVEILSHFSVLSECIKRLSETSWWHIGELNDLSRRARAGLSSTHTRLVEHENIFLHFSRDRTRYLEETKEHSILSRVQSYFRDMTEAETEIPQALISTLAHFQGELGLFRNARSWLIASVLGGAVVALLTVLFTRLFLKAN